jgi:hypothetical protein
LAAAAAVLTRQLQEPAALAGLAAAAAAAAARFKTARLLEPAEMVAKATLSSSSSFKVSRSGDYPSLD